MNTEFQRIVDRYVGSILCRIFSLFYRKSKTDSIPIVADKILIILLSEAGSLVLGYSMFQRLKKKYPGAEIYLLLFQRNREIPEILDVIPQENILTINDESLMKFAKDNIKIFLKMRKIKFNIVIDCELFTRISSILSFLSGAKTRVGFDQYNQEGLYRGSFINCPVLYNPYRHISRQFVALVEAIESNASPRTKISVNDEIPETPMVTFDEKEISRMQSRLYYDFPAIEEKKLVLVNPSGGILPIRAWPLQYYCILSKELIERGYTVAVIGLEDERELAVEIQSYCGNPGCIDLTGKTRSIRELLLILNFADLLITNDGGTCHISALTPIPTIALFGPETPELYGPHSERVSIFFASIGCSPCLTAYNHRKTPCDGDNLCLKCIQPDQVLARAVEILNSQ